MLSHSSLKTHLIIHEGKIKEMAVADGLPEAQQTIDATGLHVLPGLIDPHVYFRVPGLVYKEDFDSSSQAAAAGGITTIIDMPNVKPPTQDQEGFKPCHAWTHPDGSIERAQDDLDRIPEGFQNGEVWKRFWTEESRTEQEILLT